MSTLAYFPRAMPGELDVGHLARAQLMCGYRQLSAFVLALGASRSSKGSLCIANAWGPTIVACVARAAGQTVDEYARNHTLLAHADAFEQAHVRPGHKDTFTLAVLATRHSFHRRELRYCPQCCADQKALWGMSYWLREHQLPGMDWCLGHGRLLLEAPHGSFEPAPGERYPGRVVRAEVEGYRTDLVTSYLAATKQLLRNARPLPMDPVVDAIQAEFRRAGLRHAINYHRAAGAILIRRAPPAWLDRLLKAAEISPHQLTLGMRRKRALSVVAPLLAALAFPRGDLEKLFDSAQYQNRAQAITGSAPDMLLR